MRPPPEAERCVEPKRLSARWARRHLEPKTTALTRCGLDGPQQLTSDVTAAAIIDRLVPHAGILSLKGDSYRLRDRDLGRRPTPTR